MTIEDQDASQLAERFAVPARRFCAFVEGIENTLASERPAAAVRLLTALIAAAQDLPMSPPVTDAEGRRTDPPLISVATVDFYAKLFDPFTEDVPVAGSLSDDLGGIYSDLQEGLDLLRRGHPSDALFAWRLSFESHWGAHAVDALAPLHRIVTGHAPELSTTPGTRDEEWNVRWVLHLPTKKPVDAERIATRVLRRLALDWQRVDSGERGARPGTWVSFAMSFRARLADALVRVLGQAQRFGTGVALTGPNRFESGRVEVNGGVSHLSFSELSAVDFELSNER